MATAASTSGPTPAERAFLERWLDSAGAERANKDSFLIDLCDALELPRPEPKRNDPALDLYCFERSVPKLGPDKTSILALRSAVQDARLEALGYAPSCLHL